MFASLPSLCKFRIKSRDTLSLQTQTKRALIDFHFNLKNGRKRNGERENEEDKSISRYSVLVSIDDAVDAGSKESMLKIQKSNLNLNIYFSFHFFSSLIKFIYNETFHSYFYADNIIVMTRKMLHFTSRLLDPIIRLSCVFLYPYSVHPLDCLHPH